MRKRRRRKNNKLVEGIVVKEDTLLSLTIVIDFFHFAVYLTLAFLF